MISDGKPQRIRYTGEFECDGSVQGVLCAGFASALTGDATIARKCASRAVLRCRIQYDIEQAVTALSMSPNIQFGYMSFFDVRDESLRDCINENPSMIV